MRDFISEDDLKTFEGWLRYQAVDPATTAPEELEMWRRLFDEARKRILETPKVGLMKLQPVPGEYRYAVAIREDCDLWLTLWVRRSRKGEFFVMIPRGDRDWDPHTSYHLDGTLHMKSYGHKAVSTKRQPLTGPFRGTESLGVYAGHGPKGVGAICERTDFSGVVEVAPGVLGPRDGAVTVDLVEPDCQPIVALPDSKITQEAVFRDFLPWVVIRILKGGAPMDTEKIRGRLKDLNTKAYYLLVALSFVYGTKPAPSLRWAFTLTAVVAVLPLQDWVESPRKLEVIRCFKVICLAAALLFALWWVWLARPLDLTRAAR